MSLDTIRLSQQSKDQLVRLKRTTGIRNWNILCRWALVMSLQDPSPPLVKEVASDSNVEMDWRTFAGTAHGDVYLALLKQRCAADGEDPTEEALSRTLHVHLQRGVGYLAGRKDLRSIQDLVGEALA